MDEFQEKRGMVKLLLDMLKKSASDEVMGGMKKPEGMPDAKGLEIEKVSVLPHDEAHEHEPVSPESESMADQVMHKGELAEEMAKAPEMAAEDDAEHMDDDHEDEDMPTPPFSMLMKKKGKK